MKHFLNYTLVLLAGFAIASCAKDDRPSNTIDKGEEAAAGVPAPTTITATIPNDLTKVALTQDPDDADGAVKLSWTPSDKIYVASHGGTTWVEYVVGDLDTNQPHTATFTINGDPSNAPTDEGEGFDILYGAASLTAAETIDLSAQEQTGDAHTGHLKYFALLSGVSSIENIEFNSDWATDKGGSFKQSGVIRLRLQLPSDVTSVSSVILAAPSAIFNTTNKLDTKKDFITINFNEAVTPATQNVVTAYATIPWANVTGVSNLTAIAKDGNGFYWAKDVTLGTAIDLSTGSVNAIKLNKNNFKKFEGGTGVDGDPWQIANKWQLMNVSSQMSTSGTTYFKLLEDIDMKSVGSLWSYINPSSPYKSIDIDGNGKKISNLSNSLFYVFKGSAKNLTLDKCSATNGTHRGVFAQYIQGDGENIVTNVDVSNSTVNVGNGCMGGLVGRINNPSSGTTTATITDCDVTNTSVTGKQNGTGGLIGSVESVVTVKNSNVKGTTVTGNEGAIAVGGIVGTVSTASSFENCTFEKNGGNAATVTGPTKTGDATTSETPYGPSSIYVGGIAGEVSGAASFDDCHVKNAKVTVKNPTNNTSYWKNVGGAFGYIHNENAKIGKTTSCSVVNVEVPAHHWAAGFVSAMGGGTIENSTVSGLTISGQNFVGGFVSIINAGTISHCSVSGNAIKSANATIGGFAAYIYGVARLEYNSSSLQLGDSSNKLGTNLGGFAGQVIAAASIEDCSASGKIYSSGGSIGGFAGYVSAGSFTSCHASGDVSTTGNSVGGLLGKVSLGTVSKCSATGNVSGNQYVGGIIGQALPANETIVSVSECYYSEGTVSATNYAGGIVGLTYQGGNTGSLTITNCYMAGDVSVSGQWAGGILGSHYKGTATLENCYDTGAVTGTIGVGGIVGYVNSAGLSVTRCFPFNSGIHATNTDGTEHYSSGVVIGYAGDKKLVVNLC